MFSFSDLLSGLKMRRQVRFIPGMWGSLLSCGRLPIGLFTAPIGSVQTMQAAENKGGLAEPPLRSER
jgi:hypothetical protein